MDFIGKGYQTEYVRMEETKMNQEIRRQNFLDLIQLLPRIHQRKYQVEM